MSSSENGASRSRRVPDEERLDKSHNMSKTCDSSTRGGRSNAFTTRTVDTTQCPSYSAMFRRASYLSRPHRYEKLFMRSRLSTLLDRETCHYFSVALCRMRSFSTFLRLKLLASPIPPLPAQALTTTTATAACQMPVSQDRRRKDTSAAMRKHIRKI